MDGILTLLPGSQAVAPDGDMLYRNVMVDGAINSEKELSFFAFGKINIRALNSVLGAFQGIISAGADLASGSLNKEEASRTSSAGSSPASRRTNSSSSAWASAARCRSQRLRICESPSR